MIAFMAGHIQVSDADRGYVSIFISSPDIRDAFKEGAVQGGSDHGRIEVAR